MLVAQQASDVDILSRERLRRGVGTGWNYVEYHALGQDFSTRGSRMDEQIELLRRLWVEPLLTFEGKFDSIDRGNINPRPTPDIMFSLLYASDAPWNESQYKSEKFDAMLLEARGELDFAKRKAIYDDLQVMVANEAGTAIPVYLTNADALAPNVRGLKQNPLGGQMGQAFAEYVWLEG